LPDFVSAAEELLLDVELRQKISIDREWFKKALILRRGNYKAVFVLTCGIKPSVSEDL